MALNWWSDPISYRERLRRCSEQELEDIYYHIHILKHPDQYRAVLTEMELRELMPSIADRPLPGFYWNLQSWIEGVPLLHKQPVLERIAAFIAVVFFSLTISYLLYLPFWLLVVQFNINNLLSAFFYLFSLPLPVIAAWNFSPPYGTRKLPVAILLGAILAIALFAKTGTFQAIVEPLVKAEKSGIAPPPIEMRFR